MRQHIFCFAVFIVIFGLMSIGTVDAATITEYFDSDPGWTSFNLPVDDNDFGFRNSNLAGGNTGEAGGFFSGSDQIAWYGDDTIGNLTGNEILSASGIVNIYNMEPGYNGHIHIGHFFGQTDLSGYPNFNGIGFYIDSITPSSFRVVAWIGDKSSGLFNITGINESRTWSYFYDPDDGSYGSLTVSMSGSGGGTVKHFLLESERNSIGLINPWSPRPLNVFGLAVPDLGGVSTPEQLELYIDNVTYTSEPYVDTGFTGRTTGEADLVVARENYNSSTHQQAIYFRMAVTDNVNYEIGGTITFPSSISIVDVYHSEGDLNLSNADWAIAGGDYSGNAKGFDGQDTINWDLHTVSFNAHFSNPVDSFRVVIEYDDPLPEGASFDIQLLEGQGQYQPAYSKGIQVGNTSDGIVPGSGDYGEITQATVPLTAGGTPVANDDAYTIDEDTTLDVAAPGVLRNDAAPDVGDLLTAILVDSPTNGTLTLNPDGSFTYEPNLNFFGTDSFTYRANDGTADSDLATVTITVNPVVDPPIADAGPDQTVGEGSNVTLGGSNSFDPEGETLSYQWEQVAGRPVILSDPTAANPTFTAPSSVGPGGESLTFQLTVTDEEAEEATDTAIVNVTLPLANRPPNADAGVDQDVGEGELVTLNGSNSFDPDGDNVSYQWDQVAGPPVTLLPDSTEENPSFQAPFVESTGLSYTFELTVTDANGLQATDTTIVNVTSILPAANQPPEADAGDDQTVDEDETVTINGSNSSDPEGNLFYRWRQVAGRPVTLSDPAAEQPTFQAPNVGEIGDSLVFKLTVTDVGGLRSAVDTLVNVTGDDEFPVADAGNDQTVNENSTVTLDGSGSFDPEGQNLSYSWRQTAGHPVTLSDPTIVNPTFPAPNVTPIGIKLDFELTVADVVGLQQRDEVEISVFGDNDTPIADAGDDQTVLEQSTVTLDGSNSSDPDVDDIMSYQWNQTDGPAVILSDPTAVKPSFKAPSAGSSDISLNFVLIVTDGQGEQSQEDSTTVTVECIRYTYYRDADGDGYGDPINTTQACSLPSGYVTNDLDCDDGDPNEHPNQTWYKDADSDGYSDGSTNTSSCTRPTGFKVISELTSISGDCDDTDQNQNPDAPEVCNGEDDNCDGETDEGCVFNDPPDADAGSNQTVVEGETVTLDGSNSSDPDGDTIFYQWTQIGGIPATLSDSTAAKPTFVTPVVSSGGMILTFELVVKDDEDLQDTDNVSITVNDNGISGFPDDVLTMICSTGKEIGIKVESDLVSITAVDPATIPDSSDKPDNLPYGLFDLLIKTDAVGGTAKVTFYLETQAGANDKWFKYKDSTGTWEDCSAYASFNAARDQVTLTFVDGGDGDDGPADGWIVDPSGLNASVSASTSSGGGGGGGGGCFIATAAGG
jgi:hypothetical protein